MDLFSQPPPVPDHPCPDAKALRLLTPEDAGPAPTLPDEPAHAEDVAPPDFDLDAALHGRNLFGEPVTLCEAQGGSQSRNALADRYLIPPFSVLRADTGDWQERKRAWLGLGIESEVGRSSGLTLAEDSYRIHEAYYGKAGAAAGKKAPTTSTFDPVLCELSYRWFCPEGGRVLDPFAGGSVRGVVVAALRRAYHGIELRAEQVAANREQAAQIVPAAAAARTLTWVTGDCRERLSDAPEADYVFTCPPYGDLERYSDDPRDLSTLPLEEFAEGYADALGRAADRLRPDRFVTIVVGEYRDRDGHYVDFVGMTKRALRDAGLHFYNEAVLCTPLGTVPMRTSRQFAASRKLGKAHQNVLTYVKGSWRAAAEACQSADDRALRTAA